MLHIPEHGHLGNCPIREELSNSGNILKLLVPNGGLKAAGSRKAIIINTSHYFCKYNRLCKVTSQMMTEREIDNRGSKSISVIFLSVMEYSIWVMILLPGKESVIVKEQRVDGSLWEKHKNTAARIYVQYFSHIRCILMGFERNYRVKILPNQCLSRYYYTSTSAIFSSSITNKSILNPLFVTGFIDAEGCWTIYIRKKKIKNCFKYYSEARLEIHLHIKDIIILESIKAYFDTAGSIVKRKNSASLVICSIEEIIKVVLPHFNNYPLITKKYADYLLFLDAVYLIKNKEHLTKEGLNKIVAFKSSMNLGLSDELKRDFPSVIPAIVPIIANNKIFSPEWIAGFVSGEGSFIIKISKSRNSKLGVGVQLVFQITQHLRDEKLIKNFILYFGCGRLVKFDQKVNFIVTKFSDIIEKIIPFFNKYPIVGVKALNYKDWCEVALIIKNKGHLTKSGFYKILQIKEGMNRNR